MPTPRSSNNNLIVGSALIALVIGLGTAGYAAAGWKLSDAFYMVVITIFSVGYGEVHPIDTAWLHFLTVTLIVLGCTGMIFMTGALVQFLTASELQKFLGIKRMKNEIEQLKDHVIVCGFGRIGNMLARELKDGKTSFIVVERAEARIAEARGLGYLAIQGEATDEVVLREAGVTRARVLATVLPDDAANVFITLSARSLNKALHIIARGEVPTTEGKLLHAGADEVVLPTHIGAERIAELILFPKTAALIRDDERMRDLGRNLHSLGLDLEVLPAAEGSKFANQSIEQIERQAGGAFLIVAINRNDGSTITRPPASTQIRAGDGVVLIGRSGRSAEVESFRSS
ncbi:MAG: NAD-binding protein [Pseudomonadota bacterium]